MEKMSEIWKALEQVRDPELGYNAVELGLIYDVRYEPDTRRAHVKMTLTAPACPYGPYMLEQAKRMLLAIDGVDEAEVELVFDPPWDPYTMCSPEILMDLGLA